MAQAPDIALPFVRKRLPRFRRNLQKAEGGLILPSKKPVEFWEVFWFTAALATETEAAHLLEKVLITRSRNDT